MFKGLPREPKYSHLTKLHKVIKLCEPALVSVDPTVTSLGDKQEVMDTLQSKSNTQFKDYLTLVCFLGSCVQIQVILRCFSLKLQR